MTDTTESLTTRTVYKVVARQNATKELTSVIARGEDVVVTYRPGEWTHPVIPHSMLFAFDNLEHARLFKLIHDSNYSYAVLDYKLEIWRATAGDTHDTLMCLDGEFLDNPILVGEFWRGQIDSSIYISLVPTGTIICPAIRLDSRTREVRITPTFELTP